MRPIFCGNFEYDARQSELERLFSRYGKVDRVDMKSGISGEPIFFLDDEVASPFLPVPEPHLLAYFQELIRSTMLYGTVHLESFSRFAFIYMEDERDAEDAIRALDRTEFGRQGRRLRVEWTKQERGGGGRRSGSSRRSPANTKPTKTLFVINFDPINTRTRDLERHFETYGKILNVRIRRNFAFIHFEDQEDATKALEGTNMSKLLDRIISVEYALRDDDDKRNGYSPERRGRDRSLERRGRDNGRSPSPYGRGRERDSPDYGRGSSPYNKLEKRASPNYGRAGSPGYERDSPRQERE